MWRSALSGHVSTSVADAARSATLLWHRVTQVGAAGVDRDVQWRTVGRRFLFDLLRLATPIVAVDHGGVRYYVSTADRVIGGDVFSSGMFEDHVMQTALDILGELSGQARPLAGHTIVDVGANIGTTTIPAIKQHGVRSVVAIEPEPATFRLLNSNIAANDLEACVRPLQLALSDHVGRVHLELSPRNWGDHRVRLRSSPGEGAYGEDARRCVEVAVSRFDDVAAQHHIDIEGLGLVWLDTQGHEGHVLAGAPSLLASAVPVVTEYWPYGLRRAGGLELFHELVASHYRQVIDLRASHKAGSMVAVDVEQFHVLDRSLAGLRSTDLFLLS